MCGIAGILGQGVAKHVETVEKMAAAMAHRGPDGEGIYVSPSGACVLGHRRLAILDLSDAAAQPMVSNNGRWALVYNGECYNYRELRDDLCAKGEVFRSSGDTEVVFRLLAREDPQTAIPRMNAMFALALWDESKQTLLLARDRYGQKPFYYARVGKLLLFASEIRALLASGLIARRADPAAIRSYLSYGAVQEPQTIVAGVALLAPASSVTFEPNGIEKHNIFWLPPTKKIDLSPEDLRASFFAATRRHLVSDAPLGLFLSGGIDSAATVAAAAGSDGSHVKTLSVVFPEQPGQSEAKYAAVIARKAGTDHTEVPITGGQMLRMLPEALDAMDQPSGDGINTYIVSHAARLVGLKVALSGLGGDELFAGYSSFYDVAWMLRARRLLGPVRKPAASLLERYAPFRIHMSKIVDLLDAPPSVLSSYLTRRRVFSSRQIQKMAPGLARCGWESGLEDSFYQLLETLGAGHTVQDIVGLVEMRAYMGQTLLRDSDVMGMAHGLEIRMPFLDNDFSSSALMLEVAARTPRAHPKWRFVEAMRSYLPGDIVNRAKQGFTLPFKEWMLGELKDEITEGLHALLRTCPAMKPNVLLGLWERFIAQPEKVGWYRPWTLFVLGRYLRNHRLEPQF